MLNDFSDSPNIIIRMFSWWNKAMSASKPDKEYELSADNFAAFFTPDAKMIVNGNLRSDSLDSIAAHYQAIRGRLKLVEMILPVEAEFTAPERAFVHVRTRAITKSGESSAEEAMSYAILSGGRMSLLRVVSLSV